MDPLTLVDLTRTLVDIDSTTGIEGDCGRWLAAYLRARGWRVEEQPVTDTRFNVLATLDPPRVVFSTHFDCVPPFFPSRIEGSRLYGRGSCDAKGILASQVTAAERPRVNVTLVVDRSGSMDIRERLGLVQASLALMIGGRV